MRVGTTQIQLLLLVDLPDPAATVLRHDQRTGIPPYDLHQKYHFHDDMQRCSWKDARVPNR